jgi:hypothetical protein
LPPVPTGGRGPLLSQHYAAPTPHRGEAEAKELSSVPTGGNGPLENQQYHTLNINWREVEATAVSDITNPNLESFRTLYEVLDELLIPTMPPSLDWRDAEAAEERRDHAGNILPRKELRPIRTGGSGHLQNQQYNTPNIYWREAEATPVSYFPTSKSSFSDITSKVLDKPIIPTMQPDNAAGITPTFITDPPSPSTFITHT